MIKKQAPGETILKVGGMLLLFLGVMLAFGSGNTLSLATRGSADSAVIEYLQQNNMTYTQLVASTVMVLAAGVIYLAAGVVGVKQAGNIKNAGMCIGMERMVLTLFETSSPTIPSPLVTARVKLPSSYSNAIASPSYLHSTTNSGFETLSDIL